MRKEIDETIGAIPFFEEDSSVLSVVSLRHRGVSTGPYGTANMAFHVGDDPAAVCENRRRFCMSYGIDAARLVTAKQVHGTRIVVVDRNMAGRGAKDYESAMDDCDCLMTHDVNVPLGMHYADCAPLLFYDPVKRVVAVAHGGWRGTVGDIAGKTVAHMGAVYGTKATDLRVAIGPTIGKKHFETGADVYRAFQTLFSAKELSLLVEERGEKYVIDLPLAHHLLLERVGVRGKGIEDCKIDTVDHEEKVYSFRKSKGITGRHMALIMLR